MHTMCAGTAGVHEAQAAEQDICLNDILHRGCEQLRLHSFIGLNAVPQENIVALSCNCHPRQRAQITPTDVVRCERALVCHRLVPGDEGVCNSRGKKSRRSTGDDR